MSKCKSLFFFWIATVKSEAHVPVSGFITLLPRLSPRTLSFVPLLFMTQWIVQMGTHSDSLSLTALMASHSAVYMKSEWNSCVKNNKKEHWKEKFHPSARTPNSSERWGRCADGCFRRQQTKSSTVRLTFTATSSGSGLHWPIKFSCLLLVWWTV